MGLRTVIEGYLLDIYHIGFPHVCICCGRAMAREERVICGACIALLPETGYWTKLDNAVAAQFWGRVTLHHASAYLYVQPGNITQDLIHKLKYKGQKQIGTAIGRLYGYKLRAETTLQPTIDLIVPVPLHPTRIKTRGYNQCDYFAEGLSEVLQIPFDTTALTRPIANISQTKKTRYDRWGNVEGIFAVAKPERLAGKHILLVDDVITTGATIESCAQAVLSVPNVILSVGCMATAGR